MRTGYGHMVLDDLVHRLRELHAARAQQLAALTDAASAQAYQGRVRQSIASCFGPWPERTPLDERVTGRMERDGFRIEKVLLESRPGCVISANLYLPATLSGAAPCVLAPCGHSPEGKAAPLYQAFCQRLALAGFVVLIYDPLNQGERDQYALLDDRESVRQCTHAHNMMGKQMALLGEDMATWRVWDGMRALDYLLSRAEVDCSRVGITGNSGGGTLTTWLWALDERLTMAAPSCFVTTFLHNLENELPADAEQYPHRALAEGLEMADFLIARAPKPVAILGQDYDYFDRRGHQEACDQVRRFYDILGAPQDSVLCFRGHGPHGFSDDDQRAMLDFFCLQANMPPRWTKEVDLLPAEELWAAPGGNVLAAGARPVYALIGERAKALAERRPKPLRQDLPQAIVHLLAIPPYAQQAPHYRNLRPTRQGEAVYGRYAIETEGDIRAILRVRPRHAERVHALEAERVTRLYLPHLSAEQDLAQDPWALALQGEGSLYALDVRGLGETMPDEDGDFIHPYGMDYMIHGYSDMLGQPYLGRRVYDVLRTMTLLRDLGAEEIHLYGRGQGALLALLAAVVDQQASSVTLCNLPRSFLEWATTPLVDWPAANFIRGVLNVFDLEDCLEATGCPVTVLEPWGPHMRPVGPAS